MFEADPFWNYKNSEIPFLSFLPQVDLFSIDVCAGFFYGKIRDLALERLSVPMFVSVGNGGIGRPCGWLNTIVQGFNM